MLDEAARQALVTSWHERFNDYARQYDENPQAAQFGPVTRQFTIGQTFCFFIGIECEWLVHSGQATREDIPVLQHLAIEEVIGQLASAGLDLTRIDRLHVLLVQGANPDPSSR